MNPESGTITYNYDEAASTNGPGQLTSKSQSRCVSTTATVTTRFNYDNLGRLKSKAYTGAPDSITTAGVTYTYDTHNPVIAGITSYAKGRRTRTEVTGGTVTAFDTFDPLGRVTRSRQVTNSVTYRFGGDTNAEAGYEYLLGGGVSKQRNHGGRILSWTYDDAGRPTGVSDGTTAYATAVTYTDHGAMDSMRLNGQRIREKMSYDANRLQLTGIALANCTDNTAACSSPSALWTAGYTYSTTATEGNGTGPDNNGNPRTQDITVPGMPSTARQSYGYDGWSRLKTFSEGPAGGTAVLNDTYCFDEHGNRAVVTRPGLSPMTPQVATCSAANVRSLFPGNRISGASYDVGGGLAADGRSNLRYNAEDLLAKSSPVTGTPTVTDYEYDGDNRRVGLVTGGARTTFVYDAGGALTAEFGGSSQLAGTSYVHADALGSTRVVTDAAGAVARRMDYWPFGEEIYEGQTSYRTAALKYAGDGEPRHKFTGQARDIDTGLDYFGARYFSGAQGRFTSPDPSPLSINMSDPQSWNLYAYVRNRPTAFVDHTGMWATYIHADINSIALSGYLSSGQIAQLNARAYALDADVSTEGANDHGLRTPQQSPEQGRLAIWSKVASEMRLASPVGENGTLGTFELFHLGNAFHAVQDITSPSHTNRAGEPAIWGGLSFGVIGHGLGESLPSVNWSRIGLAIRLTLATFLESAPAIANAKGLTAATIDSIAAGKISDFVSQHFRLSQGLKTGHVLEDAARQCALGNPAACGNEHNGNPF